jgi:hypothetical protein
MEIQEGFMGKKSFSQKDMVAGIFFGPWVPALIARLRWIEGREGMGYRGRRNDKLIAHE